jgi:hypothetical protein
VRIKIYGVVCFALIISSLFVPSFIVKSVAVDPAHEQENTTPLEKFRLKMMMEFLRQRHPEFLDIVDHIKATEGRASDLAREFKRVGTEEERRHTLDRVRGLLEEATRQKFELTEMTLDGLQQRLDELRRRHHRHQTRFDEIVDTRLNRLLHFGSD